LHGELCLCGLLLVSQSRVLHPHGTPSSAVDFLPRDQREALHTARGQVGEAVWQDVDAKRAGIEGTISEAVRCHGLRRSRDRGLRKTGLQMVAVGAALNVSRVVNWLDGVRPVSARTLPLTRLRLIA
jgi:transposase